MEALRAGRDSIEQQIARAKSTPSPKSEESDESDELDLKDSGLVILSAADPLNLIGVLTPGARVPSNRHAKLVFWHGEHVATAEGGEVTLFNTEQIDRALHDRIHTALSLHDARV